MNGYVHIVESPSPKDLLNGNTEGHSLCQSLRYAGIDHWYCLATTRETLRLAVTDCVQHAFRTINKPPVMHFAMHGDMSGVQLTSGELLTWRDLRDDLRDAMEQFPRMLLCFSSCEGAYAVNMAMLPDADPSFWAIIGPFAKVGYHDSALAFVVFYTHWFRGKNPDDCVQLMRLASGHDSFRAMQANVAREEFLRVLREAKLID